jgi:nucleoside 2-deoxyribosyltransferase
MKAYVASKFEEAPLASDVMRELEALGHIITHDWTNENADGLSGGALTTYLRECAERDVKGVVDCDVLVLLNHPHGKGMFTELGIAIARKKRIIVVQRSLSNNIFLFLSECECVSTIDEAIGLVSR